MKKTHKIMKVLKKKEFSHVHVFKKTSHLFGFATFSKNKYDSQFFTEFRSENKLSELKDIPPDLEKKKFLFLN